MILTITLNPAVDIRYTLKQLSLDTVNRVNNVSKTAGGKGLNVSRVLRQLDVNVAASGFLGGSLGGFIRKQIAENGIHDYFVPINGETRNCIAIIHESKQTEVLEAGPVISEKEAILFMDKFAEYVSSAEYVTISGSLPKGVPSQFYADLIQIAAEHDTPVLLDTKGELLQETLMRKRKPFFIKPNQDELADLLGKKVEKDQDIIQALQLPLFDGVEWIAVTLGADGALIKHQDAFYRARAPKINAVNPVGSGDSVIAGFAGGLSQNMQGIALMKYGLSMGILNAMEEQTGHINTDNIPWCMDEIDIQKMEI